MEEPHYLVINRSDSRCGTCGKGANWREQTHETVLGLFPEPGCGVRWTHVTSDYISDQLRDRIKEMRPDLEPDFLKLGPYPKAQ